MKAGDYDTVEAMASRIVDHPAARMALKHIEQAELTAIWTDEETGVRCKARFDGICPEIGTVVDLKSTTDASPDAFSRSIYVYKYFLQAAVYLEAANATLPDTHWNHFVIVAQEKDPPYAVAAYRLRDDALIAGRDQMRQLLERYAECVERDHWPGYSEAFVEIDLPYWAWKKLESEVYN